MVRNSRLIFFHVVSLAVPGSPALLWHWQGQSAPGTGEFPVPCRGARGCRGAVPSPLCRQAGRGPVRMVSIRRLAELTPTQGSYNQQSHPFCLQNHLSSCTKAETNQNQLWPCPLPQGTHTLCLCLLGCPSLPGQCWAMHLPASSTVLSRGTWQSFRKATGQALMETEGKFLYQSS